MPNQQKTPNAELMYTISTVSEAIRDKQVMKFTYLKYDKNKQLVPRREDPYYVEPRYIVYSDSRPYLIVTSKNHEGFIHYRLDRMKDCVVLNEKSRVLPKTSDPYEYARNKLFMYNGEIHTVTFKCKESVMDHMIDIFGSELLVIPNSLCFATSVIFFPSASIFSLGFSSPIYLGVKAFDISGILFSPIFYLYS